VDLTPQRSHNAHEASTKRLSLPTILLVLCCQLLDAQQPEKLVFDVLSIKPVPHWVPTSGTLPPIPSRQGGPGTSSPTRLVIRNFPLRDLLTTAYGVPTYLVSGPAWLVDVIYAQTDTFDVSATMPADTTKEQLAIMLQNALTERFNLKVHREDKAVSGYALTVGSHGSKLQRLAEAAVSNSSEDAGVSSATGKDGFPVTAPEYSGIFVKVGMPVARVKFMRRSMTEVADWLAQTQLKRPVTDRTGLAGQYSFLLEYQMGTTTMDPSEPGPPADTAAPGLFTVLESTLGLRVVREPCQVKMLVIDHADRIPSAN
jgi:uncharacterized protein (TIGR03435 family)